VAKRLGRGRRLPSPTTTNRRLTRVTPSNVSTYDDADRRRSDRLTGTDRPPCGVDHPSPDRPTTADGSRQRQQRDDANRGTVSHASGTTDSDEIGPVATGRPDLLLFIL
jgi:hypothetical protein